MKRARAVVQWQSASGAILGTAREREKGIELKLKTEEINKDEGTILGNRVWQSIEEKIVT